MLTWLVIVGVGLKFAIANVVSGLRTRSCDPQDTPAGIGKTICVAETLVSATGVLLTSTVANGEKLLPVIVIAAPTAVEFGVTLVIVGQSRRGRWHQLLFGSVIERLISARRGLDVLVVSADERENARSGRET